MSEGPSFEQEEVINARVQLGSMIIFLAKPLEASEYPTDKVVEKCHN